MPKQIPQTVEASIHAGELPGMERTWSTMRRNIDLGGALDVFDGFGSATVKVNGKDIVLIQLRENADGVAVVAVYGVDGKGRQSPLGEFDLEAAEIVPPRPTRERRA